MSSYTLEYGTFSSGLSLTYGDSLSITGGTATDTTLVGAVTNINSGLLEYTAMSGGSMEVSHDAFVQNTVMSGGTLYASGGQIENTTLEGGAYFSAAYNAAVTGTTVNSGGRVYTSANDFDDTVVNSGGRVDVYGGTANNFTVNASGSADFSNRTAFVNNLVINGAESYQYATVHASNYATVNGATVTGSYGYLNASGGATLSNVTLNDGGHFNLSAGGTTVDNVQINEGGSMTMSGNASMSEVSVNYGGWFSAGFGGYYGSYTIYEEDALTRMGGAIRENGGAVYLGSTTIERWDSSLGDYVYSSGVAYPVEILPNAFREIVYSDGRQGTVHSNTVAYNITARWGGLTVYDGGVVEGYTVTPYTYDSAYERWQYHEHYNSETEDWEYTSEFVSGIETVTELGNLTVVAGGTVTGLVAQAMPGDKYSWDSYLNFEIAPNTLITGTIDGQSFMVQNGDMRPGLLKNANLTYMGGVIASGVSQINGNATFKEGVIASDMVFSGTSVTFNRGATVEFVRTAPMPYVYTEYEGGFGDQEEEPEETIVSTFMGAHVDVYAGAQVRSIEMTDKDYLHMQVAPNTVLTGTSGGVELNMTNGVFTSASLGSTYVEVMGGTTSIDETTAGTAVTIAGGTVSDLIVNPGACVSAAEGATALNLTENGGAVLLGWGNEIPATITYSINSNTFSYDHLVGSDNPITVHKNTSALDNIMFGGELQVFSGGVVSNFYTVGSGMNMNMISLYEGAIVTNIDTVRYSDPGKYHPGQIDFNKNVTANVARLTDYDGITLFVGPDSVLTNGSVDNVPFSIENGVLSGFLGSDESWFGDTIGIYRGAGMIDCRTDQWANVNIWQGGYGYNNTFADGYVYVGDTAYDDESEEGGIALLEKSTLGVAGNRDKATTLYVRQNGVVRDITVNAGSVIEVSSGGKLTGKIRKNSNTINIGYGGYLDFDITAQDALTEARIDSLWNVTNDGRYSITIDGMNQAGGTYVLADSTYFNDIFFWNDNAVIYFDLMDVSGSTFGYFYMAEENQYHYDEETGDEWYESVVAINYVATSREQQPNFEFSLSEGKRFVDDGGYYTTLLFTVNSETVAPEWVVAPTVTADIITFTPSDVVLTVEYSDDAVTKEYSLDGQIWTAFPTDGAAVVSPVSGGTTTEVTYSSFIPNSEDISTSSAVYIDGGDVTGGTTALIGEDGTPTRGGLRAVIPADEEEAGVVFDITADDALKTARYEYVEPLQSYTILIDGQNQAAGTYILANSTGFFTHETMCFDVVDVSGATYGYISAYHEYQLSENPEESFSNFEAIYYETSGTVQPNFTFSLDLLRSAGADGSLVFTVNAPVITPTPTDDVTTTLTVTANGTYYFRGISVDGVVSDVTSYRVSNIDKVAPTAPTDLAAVATEDGVRLSWAESSDDYSGIRKYIVTYKEAGSGQSITVETPYKFLDILNPVPNDSAVGTVIPAADPSDYEWSVQAVDYAGNVSEATEFFNGIPGPVASASITTPTNSAVNVVIGSLNPDVAQYEYSLDDQKTWNKYDLEGLVISENITVWLRGITVDGVYTKTTFIKIDNIDLTPPEAPIAAASTTDPTNQEVIVTATFSNDTAIREASVDGENWIEYPANGMFLSENGNVYFRGTDAAGNVSDVTNFLVNNIDTVAPTAPVASMTTADTFDGVLVSAVFSDDSVTKEYSFDGKRWIPYEGAVAVSELGTTVLFHGIDAAGNESEVTAFTVNSFEAGPDAPVASADVTTLTNGDVTVAATFAEDAAVNQYSLNGLDWFDYTDGIVFRENNTVYFRSADAAGNFSAITVYTVDNIDKVAPEAPIAAASTNEATNQDVLVTATFSNDSVVRECSTDGENWTEYSTNGVLLSENGKVFFRSADAAGNVSEVTEYEVTNIDKIPPAVPVASMTTADTFDGVIVSAVFSEDSRIQEYSFNADEWSPYDGGVPVSELGTTVFFRGIDAAGNVSEITSFTVNSFTAGPDAPVAVAGTTEPTNQDVYVTARFDETAELNEYSLDGQTWLPYPDEPVFAGGPIAIQMTENGTVYFRSMDADGNYSAVTACTIDNIDKVAPEAPVAYADITEPTNQNVTVYARFSDDSVVRQYRLISHGEEWFDYPDSTGVVLSENDSVVFRGIDAAGNESNVLTLFSVTNIDKVAPTAPTVSASAAVLPAGKGVDVTATFSDDSVKQEYSLDGRTWNQYNGPVLFTELGTAYFRGTDAAGNVSDVTKYEVTKLSLGPAAPFAFADITAPTNQDVTVYATFDDSAVVRKYAINTTSSWRDYTDAGVVLSQNGTVYFACVDADGEGSDMTTFVVSNIDKVAPEKPVASASTTENTFEPVVVTATFSEDSVQRQYSFDGSDAWYDYYEGGITFDSNGFVYFRGIDEAGNVSDLAAYSVTNILEAEPDDAAADDGWNDVMYDKKTKELTDGAWEVHAYDLAEVYRFQKNAPTLNLQLDKFGSISENDNMTNAVGGKRTENGKTVYDVDCMRIEMSVPGWVSLAVKATQAVKLSVIQVTWADDKVKMKTLQTTKVKADDFTLSKPLLIDPMNGEDSMYFVTVEGISPKKDGVAYYRVSLDMGQSNIFFQANNDDNWTDMKENGHESYEFQDLGMLEEYYDDLEGVVFVHEDWVGYGSDDIDYYKFTVENNAKLTFSVDAASAVKLGIYTLAGKEGNYSLKNVLKPTPTSSGSIERTLQLSAGTYYFSVEANNKKITDADYKVEISGRIYNQADNNDDWTDLKTKGPAGKVYDAGIFTEDTIGTPLEEEGWVGFGDEIDFKVFRISGPANLNFTIGANDAVKFTVYEVKKDKKGKWSLSTFKKNVATITAPKDGSDFYEEASTGSIFLSDPNAIYAYSVQSMNANKGGNADYNVMLDSDGSGFIPTEKDPAGMDNTGLSIKTKGFLDGANGGSVEIMNLEQWASDSKVENGSLGYTGWVGYGDAIDTLGFKLTADTPIQSITIQSTDAISVALSKVVRSGKNYKMTSIVKTTKLHASNAVNSGYAYTLILDGLDGKKKKSLNLGAGDYVITIKSTNASKGGNADYKLTLACDALQKVQNADALTDLSMPETSDELALSNELSLGQFAETSSAISSAVTDALDDKLGSVMNASWTTLA